MSSVFCFNLDQSKIVSSGNELMLYNMIWIKYQPILACTICFYVSCFYVSAEKNLMKTLWEKEKLLVTSNFSFSLSVVYYIGELPAILIKFKNCRLQTLSFWNSLKFVVWEKVIPSIYKALIVH